MHRWKLLDQCHQAFWQQWSTEYLTTLQVHTKWSTGVANVRLNDIVVIRDSQSSPLSWRMGRVIALLPGADGVVRVVRLRTTHGEITRPVVKLVILPTHETRPGPLLVVTHTFVISQYYIKFLILIKMLIFFFFL